ncbi:aquaporin [Rhodopirellula bahusiensis]|uniref:Nodulin-26 n=1 Tax=Rhodopirellula bahusiensis TaxID=2014065 RepID=A0A2G1W751_9BACT|nr:aquaporin [Rhodopirellula bahusiensis]PHQ34847.1 nodulin-26 [Rhodopirellula bahusiensis]
MQLSLTRRCVCEVIGTYCLVLIGCGAMVVDNQTGMLTHVGVATVWGLIVMTMIYSIGDLSGAHMNPAVSIAFASVGRLPVVDAAAYIVAQCAGALLAAGSLGMVFGVDDVKLGSTMASLPTGSAWAVEFMMTMILMWIVLGVSTGAKEKSITAGLAVGATIAMEAFVAGPLTKASMNPARSLGPAVMSNHYNLLWLYLTAPIVGAIAGGWLYRFVRGNDELDTEECVMVKKVSAVVFFALIFGVGGGAAMAEEGNALLHPQDRIAVIGGTFVERMQPRDELEAALQTQRPDWKLSVRNLGWSGDTVAAIARKRFDNIEAGRARRLADIDAADPTVALLWYGQSEAGAFAENAERNQADLISLIDEMQQREIRVILLTPVAMPGDRRPNYESGLEAFEQMLRNVARAKSLALVELNWQPTDEQLVDDRMLPNEVGYRDLAKQLAGALLGEPVTSGETIASNRAVAEKSLGEAERKSLLEAIARKNEFFFHRYRPQNETYLFLFRKHEQGNNAVEIEQFEPIIRKADEAIWDAAQAD